MTVLAATYPPLPQRRGLQLSLLGLVLAVAILLQPLWTIAGLLGLAAVAAVIWRPVWALVALLFFVPFNVVIFAVLNHRFNVQTGPLTNWKDVLVGLLAVRAVVAAVRREGFSLPRDPLVLYVLFFVLAMSVFAAASPDAKPAAYGLAHDVEGPLLFVTILALRPSRPQLAWCLGAIVLAAALMSVAGLVERIPQADFPTFYGAPRPDIHSSFYAEAGGGQLYRSGSFFDSPLLLGFYLAGTLPLTIALAIAAQGRARLALAIAAVLETAALGVTVTRTAYIGATLGLIVVCAVALRGRARRMTLATLGMMICAVIVGVTSGGADLLTRQSENGAHFGSLVDDLDVISQSPFGLGVGTTDDVRFRFDVAVVHHASESNYLARGIETGVVGLMLFLVLLFGVGMRMRRVALDEAQAGRWNGTAVAAGALGALAGVAASGLFIGTQELAPDSVYWSAAAVAVLLALHARAADAATAR